MIMPEEPTGKNKVENTADVQGGAETNFKLSFFTFTISLNTLVRLKNMVGDSFKRKKSRWLERAGAEHLFVVRALISANTSEELLARELCHLQAKRLGNGEEPLRAVGFSFSLLTVMARVLVQPLGAWTGDQWVKTSWLIQCPAEDCAHPKRPCSWHVFLTLAHSVTDWRSFRGLLQAKSQHFICKKTSVVGFSCLHLREFFWFI